MAILQQVAAILILNLIFVSQLLHGQTISLSTKNPQGQTLDNLQTTAKSSDNLQTTAKSVKQATTESMPVHQTTHTFAPPTLPPTTPESCPEACVCDDLQHKVICNNKNLHQIPQDLPSYTSYLTLNSNNFGKLQPNSFSFLPNLLSLQMVSCNISKIEDNAFNGLRNLRKLDLRNNGLSTIRREHFSGIDGLIELHLQGNQLNNLEPNSFSNLENLQQLYLDNNPISTLPENMFSDTNALQVLSLRFCSFSEVPSLFFNKTVHLQELDLLGNAIRMLPANGFNNLGMLKMLHLTGMFPKLEEMDQNSFNGLSSLEILDLSDNLLQSLTVGHLSRLTNLQQLHLQQNPWNCNCIMGEFMTWLRTTEIDYFDQQWQCNLPQLLNGQIVFTIFPTEKFACEPYFFSEPFNTALEYEEGAFFECEVRGDPTPIIEWFLPGGTLITGTTDASNEYVERDGALLIIRQALPYHVGEFMVRATNSRGSSTVTFQVIVINLPVTTATTSPRPFPTSTAFPPPCIYIPIQVLVRDITDTSAVLQWMPYNNLDLRGYILQVMEFGGNVDDVAIFVENTETSYMVTSLQQNTNYILCVTVYLEICPSFNSLDQCVQITTRGDPGGDVASEVTRRHRNELIGVAVACIAGTLLVMASIFLILWQYQRPRSYTKYDFKNTEDTTRFADIEPSLDFGDMRIEEIGSHRDRNGRPHIYDNPALDTDGHDYEAPDVHQLRTFKMEVDVHSEPEDSTTVPNANGTLSTTHKSSINSGNGTIVRINSETESEE